MPKSKPVRSTKGSVGSGVGSGTSVSVALGAWATAAGVALGCICAWGIGVATTTRVGRAVGSLISAALTTTGLDVSGNRTPAARKMATNVARPSARVSALQIRAKVRIWRRRLRSD